MGYLGEGYEDILAIPEVTEGLLKLATGSIAIPQLQTSDGSWIQDSSDIMDFIDAHHNKVPVIPSATPCRGGGRGDGCRGCPRARDGMAQSVFEGQ